MPIGAAALVAFVGWYGVEAAVAHTWLALSYYFDGHPWDVSNAAAFGRGPRADDLPLLFLPFWSAVTLSPLAAFESRPRHRWITFAMIIGMGAIATIAFRYEYFASR